MSSSMCSLWKAPYCNWLVAAYDRKQAAEVNNKSSDIYLLPENLKKIRGSFIEGRPRIIDLDRYDKE